MSRLIATEEIRRLSRRAPLRASLAIARQWAVIAAVIVVTVRWAPWYLYPVAIVVIATRQHALAVLMHDGAHRLLYQRRWLNDLVSDVFLAFPLFVSTTLYRRHHLEHHRYLNTEKDPDLDTVSLSLTTAQWCRLFLGDLTGISLLKTVDTLNQFSLLPVLRGDRRAARAMGRARLSLFLLHLAAQAALVALLGLWWVYPLLWIAPMLTALSMILRVRAVAEHVGCDPASEISGTRTVLPGPVEQLIFAPCLINYHLAHHLYPSVPFYNLKVLHRQLIRHPEIRAQARISRSYLLGQQSVLRHIAAARDGRALA